MNTIKVGKNGQWYQGPVIKALKPYTVRHGGLFPRRTLWIAIYRTRLQYLQAVDPSKDLYTEDTY